MMPLLKRRTPRLSLILVVFRMPRQALNTLHSLSPTYQQGADPSDYEVIVVEKPSDRILGGDAVQSLGKPFRYFFHETPSVSPASAVNFGVAQARAPMVGILIDGARMLTPGVVRLTLSTTKLSTAPVASAPGYHLGRILQQEAVLSGYDEEAEQRLLEDIQWPTDGYRLFDIACFSGSCAHGFFNPMAESNCLSMPKSLFRAIGGMDERFDLPGGGLVNLDLYKRACEYPGVDLFILHGEGTFHQFHGGATTGNEPEKRNRLIEAMQLQYQTIRGERFRPPETPPVFLGPLTPRVEPFVTFSAQKLRERRPVLAARSDPNLSIVVVIHRMARQAGNTLHTLSKAYQRNVAETDYEVIVVENRSDDMLGETAVKGFGESFRYLFRHESGVSPAGAMNDGLAQARAPLVCLMIDGARMASPRVIEFGLLAGRLSDHPLITVPGYHIGEQEQNVSRVSGHDESVEQQLLERIDWRSDGYRLFDVSCLGPGNRNGFFLNMFESNCLICARSDVLKIGGMDLRFQSPGGGMTNLDLFRRLMDLPDTRFMILPGEGTFHQFHGGVTTRETENNQGLYDSFKAEYATIRGAPFHIRVKEPLMLGVIDIHVQRFIQASSVKAMEKAGEGRLNPGGGQSEMKIR